MATISRFRAVAMIGKFRLTGFVAWLMWLARPPPLPDRLQEPGHRGAALGGLLPGPRPVRAHRHRAADLRPHRRSAASSTARPTWCRRPGPSRPSRLVERARAELEAIAAEEARLTDAGERGVKVEAETGCWRGPSLEVGGAGCPVRFAIASRAHFGRMNTPSASTVTPSRSVISPLAQVLMPSDRSIQASARRSPSGVRWR